MDFNFPQLAHGGTRGCPLSHRSPLHLLLACMEETCRGFFEELAMDLVKKCHREAWSFCACVLTTVRIQDESGANDKLNENIASIERAAGHQLKHRCRIFSPRFGAEQQLFMSHN